MRPNNLGINNFTLFFLLLLSISLPIGAFADNFYVEKDGSDSNNGSSNSSSDAFLTIQGAIDNSSVNDDDEIYVGEGTFKETINIWKSVTLYGDGTNDTIIDAESSDGNAITVSEDDVTIKHLTITGANGTDGVAIYVKEDVEDFHLSYCELTNNYIGCHLNNTEDAIIYDNDFTENEIGLYLYSANDTSITENDFQGNATGILARISEIGDIEDNDFDDNNYGIYLDGDDDFYNSDDEDDLENDNDFNDSEKEDVYLDTDDDEDYSCFISSTGPGLFVNIRQSAAAFFKSL